MLRFLSIVLLSMVIVPAMAEQPLSPVQIETLPFEQTAQLNTTPITEEIDMSAEVEHLAAHGEAKAGLPQFDVTTFSSQLFWLAVTFLVLYVFFAKSALPKLSSTIENRRHTIRADLSQADKISNDIDATRNAYETAMQKAHDDARGTITDVEQFIRKDAEKQAAEFQAKSAQAISDLEIKAEEAKTKVKAELDIVASDLTADIINKLSSLNVKDADIQKAIAKHSTAPSTSPKKKVA